MYILVVCNGQTAGWVGCPWGVMSGSASIGHPALFADFKNLMRVCTQAFIILVVVELSKTLKFLSHLPVEVLQCAFGITASLEA